MQQGVGTMWTDSKFMPAVGIRTKAPVLNWQMTAGGDWVAKYEDDRGRYIFHIYLDSDRPELGYRASINGQNVINSRSTSKDAVRNLQGKVVTFIDRVRARSKTAESSGLVGIRPKAPPTFNWQAATSGDWVARYKDDRGVYDFRIYADPVGYKLSVNGEDLMKGSIIQLRRLAYTVLNRATPKAKRFKAAETDSSPVGYRALKAWIKQIEDDVADIEQPQVVEAGLVAVKLFRKALGKAYKQMDG